MTDRGSLVVRYRLGQRSEVRGPKPVSTDDPPFIGFLHVKSYVMAKSPPVGVVRKFRGAPVEVSSMPSDSGSKLRCSSLNSPRFALKRHVNIF
ncbi:hypothetical protein AVEN_243656-1 [Araneus ventricosus]|uniref:Uncharacterized protein n=1 Tax=Araneus ventricosus TaxID=182803 RepID=A0A4Y2A501_ARAVE|nr:hypothetical protein AVEN_243656-1 [Araneus ventricosus]